MGRRCVFEQRAVEHEQKAIVAARSIGRGVMMEEGDVLIGSSHVY
jgi:hypothetical protein